MSTVWMSGPRVAARRWIALCFYLPVAALIGAYVWLALAHRTFALAHVIVHENGRYTLTETIFYFNHFLREIPTLLMLVAIVLATHRPTSHAVHPARSSRRRVLGWAALSAAAALCAIAFTVAAQRQGWGLAVDDFFQFRTRDGLRDYGSHWRFHWLSTVWLGAIAFIASATATRMSVPLHPPKKQSLILSVVAFTSVSLVFRFSTDIFIDPRYIGHQAREIFTHSLVTLPLAAGTISLLALRRGHLGHSPSGATASSRLAWLVALLVPCYLASRLLSGSVIEAGQTESGAAAVVAAHMFEHLLDYVFVVLVAAGGFALMSDRRATSVDDGSLMGRTATLPAFIEEHSYQSPMADPAR